MHALKTHEQLQCPLLVLKKNKESKSTRMLVSNVASVVLRTSKAMMNKKAAAAGDELSGNDPFNAFHSSNVDGSTCGLALYYSLRLNY